MARVICDIDGVLAAFTEHLVSWLNKTGRAVRRGHLYSVAEFRDYVLTTVIPKEHLKEASQDPNFVYFVPRYDGAQQFLKDLLALGYEVHLVTAPWTGSYHKQAREDFVEALTWRMGPRVTFEWATSEERLMMPGDFLVDDRFETAAEWGKRGRQAIVIERPWNVDFDLTEHPNVRRVWGYDGVLGILGPAIK